MGPMGPRGLGPYVNIMDVLCIKKKTYINILVTVMVLLNVGPMGPRGLGPNHFSSLSQNYFVFFTMLGVPKIKNVIFHENRCMFCGCLLFWQMLT